MGEGKNNNDKLSTSQILFLVFSILMGTRTHKHLHV